MAALVYCDSFDHYTTTTDKGWFENNNVTISATAMRTGTYGMLHRYYNSYIKHSFGANYINLTIGFALKVPSGLGGQVVVFYLIDPAAYDSGGPFRMDINTAGDLIFYRHYSGGDIWIATVSAACPLNSWHHIEVSVTLKTDATGKIWLKVDGVEKYKNEAVTTTTYSGQASVIQIGQGGNGYDGYYRYMDDLFIHDTYGTFWGDCSVECSMPSGAGNYTQWTPSAGNNWDCVEEIPPSTSEYVSTATAGNKDSYATGNLATASGTVQAVAANMIVQKTAPGTKTIRALTRLSSTDATGATVGVGTDWMYYQQALARPGGGSWSVSDVNSAEFGIELVA